jgi:hypothetical protein
MKKITISKKYALNLHTSINQNSFAPNKIQYRKWSVHSQIILAFFIFTFTQTVRGATYLQRDNINA